MPMEDNPLYRTSLQILEDENILPEHTHLHDFNKNFRPESLGDIFGVDFMTNIPYWQVFVPWLHHRPLEKYRDVAFVNFDLEKKVDKLKHLITSIKEHGFVPGDFPDRKGGITGYHLSALSRKRLYIVSGNHRSAVLSALGKEIQHQPERGQGAKARELEGIGVDYDTMPLIFSSQDVTSWPSVKSGFLSESEAITIMNKYVEI